MTKVIISNFGSKDDTLYYFFQVTEEGSTKLFKTTVGGELWPTELTATLQ